MTQLYPFDWRIGRLEDLHISSLRYMPPFISGKDVRRIMIFYGLMVLISLSSSIWLSVTLIVLPIVVFFYSGLIQHWRFHDVVNKKFEFGWELVDTVVERILIEKERPFDRQYNERNIRFVLEDDGVEIQLAPCREYVDPKSKEVRWMIDAKGKVTDVAIFPFSDDNYLLIESLTLKLDQAIATALRHKNEALPNQ